MSNTTGNTWEANIPGTILAEVRILLHRSNGQYGKLSIAQCRTNWIF